MNELDRIKRIAVTAMVSDDVLFDTLVLKGGNAMSLIHKLEARSSIDLDFSMQHDLGEDLEDFTERVRRALTKVFKMHGYVVFDVKSEEKPKQITEDMSGFWGGYAVEFKLISEEKYTELDGSLEDIRRNAISIGQGKKFLVDFSRFEYVACKQEAEIDGFRIYVYSPEMIVCEKLRAICQQMPEYGPIIKRARSGAPRARDFVDIFNLIEGLSLNLFDNQARETLAEMFNAKKVPLEFLDLVGNYLDFHKVDFDSVLATSKNSSEMKEFEFYFQYVLGLIEKLKPLRNV